MSQALITKGLAAARAREYAEALTAFDTAHAKAPSSHALYYKAVLLFHLDRYDEVVNLAAPPYPDGLQTEEIEFLSDLREECSRRTGLNPAASPEKDSSALFNQAFKESEKKLWQEAARLFSEVLDIDPSNYVAWNNKADQLMHMGRYQHALICVLIAITCAPEEAIAWCTLGELLARLNFFDEALDCFEQFVRRNTNKQHAAYVSKQLDRISIEGMPKWA